MRANYLAFLIVGWILAVSMVHPENIRGLLHQDVSAAGKVIHFIILGVVLSLTGYLSFKQGVKDYRLLREKLRHK